MSEDVQISLPPPFYADDLCTIYHADCREVLPLLGKADLILTDPPYGIAHNTMRAGMSNAAPARNWKPIFGDAERFDPRWLLALSRRLILWGANYYAELLPPASRWLIWDKREGGASNHMADVELAWSNLGGPARIFSCRWMGMIRATERGLPRSHPTQKPVVLMTWCLDQAQGGAVTDPYMGSGAVLVAAKRSGRRSIGIEIERDYCEAAADRLDSTRVATKQGQGLLFEAADA